MLFNNQLKFFCLLIGENYSHVKNYQYSSKKKIILMGSSLLIPVLTWVIFTTLIEVNIYNKSLPFSIGVGCFAGIMIFLIERSIILSSPKNNGWKIFIGLFRIILGLAIALLSASFIDQILFQKEIDTEVHNLHEDAIKNKFKQQVSDLEIREKQALNDWKASEDNVREEANGTGGEKIRGVGAVTKLNQKQASNMENLYNVADSQLKTILNKRNTEMKNVENGFLTRIKALN